MMVRVSVLDAWDEVALDLAEDTTVAQLKAEALRRARVMKDPAGYEVKFRGAELIDEGQTLAQAGVVPNAALIVLPRRRQPVR